MLAYAKQLCFRKINLLKLLQILIKEKGKISLTFISLFLTEYLKYIVKNRLFVLGKLKKKFVKIFFKILGIRIKERLVRLLFYVFVFYYCFILN